MQVLGNERQNSRDLGQTNSWRTALVGDSPAMQQVAEVIAMIAARRTTVLIFGETGSGKEVIARAIHLASPRSTLPFVAVNCAAIPKDLLEVELFGHLPGAFTGAVSARTGRFEQAEGGTLLLDEIGDMSLEVQAKILRVLQEREYQRIGSSETVKTDVRVLAATNVDLLSRMKQGRFREDLYYRLHVVPLRVPPLRERLSDIPDLARHFIHKIAREEGLSPKTLHPDAVTRLLALPWPGNVRQFENAIEMAMVVSGERPELLASDFSTGSWESPAIEMNDGELVKLPERGLDFESVIARIELNLLEQALRRTNGNKKLAADLLGLKRTTLAAKLKVLDGAAPGEDPAYYER